MGFKERYTITCCKDCTERHEACWGSCEKYLAQRADLDERKKKAQIQRGVSDQRFDSLAKATRYTTYRSKYRKGH